MPTQATNQSRKLQTKTNSQILVELNPKQAELINVMLVTGIWGNTPKQVLTRIIDQKLANL